MASADSNGKCLKCKNGYTLNYKRDQCHCINFVNKNDNLKCQTCEEVNLNCLWCDKKDPHGKCKLCDERIADLDEDTGRCTICKNGYTLNENKDACICTNFVNSANADKC